MESGIKVLDLGKIERKKDKKSKHIPSKIQADTLFTFTTRVEYLTTAIEERMISPRYCEEDLRYLKISGIKKMAYPMKCFCDINMHKLDDHLGWYGHYGMAFSKAWGMENGIQPVQYINPASYLCKDFAKAFSAALKIDSTNQSMEQKKMKNCLLHQLMYYKPYSGMFINRNTGKSHKKCFTDECEWRYIPDVTVAGFQQVYYDEKIINAGGLRDISNSMSGIPDISLKFTYSDLKYIIVKTKEDFAKLTTSIGLLKLEPIKERELISKIIVWDNSRGDF